MVATDAVGGDVGGNVEELDGLAEVLNMWAKALDQTALQLSEAMRRLAWSRSEGLEWLFDHGSTVARHGASLSGLSDRARSQAVQFRCADDGNVGGGAATMPVTANRPVVYGPARPKRPAAGPGNWAGVDPQLIVSGKRLADSLRLKSENSNFTDAEITKLAAWWWDANQRDDVNAIRQVISGLSVRDVERLRREIAYFDWNAYGTVLRSIPPELESVMQFLAGDKIDKLSDRQFAEEVQRRLKVTDPVVLDAIRIYLRYQIGTARFASDAEWERYGELIWGWNLPVLVPEWWSKWLALDSYGSRTDRPDTVADTTAVIVGLIRGAVYGRSDRERIVMYELARRPGSTVTATATGVVVGLAVAALLPEAAMAASIAAGLEALGVSEATAAIAGGLVATAMAGGLSGLASGVASRVVLAVTGKIKWDAVLDPDTTAREVVLGGLMSLAEYGIKDAMKKLVIQIADASTSGQPTEQKERDLRVLNDALARTVKARNELSGAANSMGGGGSSAGSVDPAGGASLSGGAGQVNSSGSAVSSGATAVPSGPVKPSGDAGSSGGASSSGGGKQAGVSTGARVGLQSVGRP